MGDITTQLSGKMDRAKGCTVTEASELLLQCACIRTLGSKLAQYADGRELEPLLSEGYQRNHPEMSRECAHKNAAHWLDDKVYCISRKTAIELCFIMGLSLKDADALTAMISGERLRWRDPEEIVYLYALNQRMDYRQAEALYERMKPCWTEPVEPQTEKRSVIGFVREHAALLETEEALKAFLLDARVQLRKSRDTAYIQFMIWMKRFEAFTAALGLKDTEEKAMTTRDAVRMEMHAKTTRRLPEGGTEAGENGCHIVRGAIQRFVHAGWPDETAVSRMKNREEGVTRTVMILLFLAVFDGMDAFEEPVVVERDAWHSIDEPLFNADFDIDDKELTDEAFFEHARLALDNMLDLCGYNELDPREPFDWMTLYCLCAKDCRLIDERLSAFLSQLYADEAITREK